MGLYPPMGFGLGQALLRPAVCSGYAQWAPALLTYGRVCRNVGLLDDALKALHAAQVRSERLPTHLLAPLPSRGHTGRCAKFILLAHVSGQLASQVCMCVT